MTHLYLIRHADYIYDLVDGKYPKQNQGLSPDGVKEAEKLRDRLASGEIKPDVLISSSERGAMETAQMIAPVLGQPIIPDKDFEEWRSEDGTLSDDEFMSRWNSLTPVQKPYYHFVEGCESRIEFTLRIHKALNRILEEHDGKTILVVTHGAVIQTSFMFFFGYGEANLQVGAAPEIRRTSITHWYKPDGGTRWILERSNDCHHT